MQQKSMKYKTPSRQSEIQRACWEIGCHMGQQEITAQLKFL